MLRCVGHQFHALRRIAAWLPWPTTAPYHAEIRRTGAAVRACQPAPQVNGGVVLAANLSDQTRHVKHAAVLAASADRNGACARESWPSVRCCLSVVQ